MNRYELPVGAMMDWFKVAIPSGMDHSHAEYWWNQYWNGERRELPDACIYLIDKYGL